MTGRRAVWLVQALPPVAFSSAAWLRQLILVDLSGQLEVLWKEQYGERPDLTVTGLDVLAVPMTEDGGVLRAALRGEHIAVVHVHVTLFGPPVPVSSGST